MTLPAAVTPEALPLGLAADGRIDLGFPSEAGHVLLLAERQIVDASLDGRGDALLAVGGGERVPAREGAMHDVGGAAGRRRELVDLGDREHLGDRRAREPVRAEIGLTRGLDPPREGAHGLVVLVVHACDEAGWRDRGKSVVQDRRRNAGEALRVRLEGRELERRRTGPEHVGHVARTVRRADRAEQREIHARFAAGRIRLLGEPLAGADQVPVVIGHVDDGRHAAGRRRRVDQSNPSCPACEHECTCASIAPGSTSADPKSWRSVAAGGGPAPTRSTMPPRMAT